MLKNQGVHKIIAPGHAGFNVDKKIALQVEDIDIVVGGHTNTFLHTGKPPSNEDPVDVYPKVVIYNNGDDVLVVQDYDFAKYLGYLQVEFDDNGVVIRYNGNPILLDNTIPKGNLIADGMVHQNLLHADSVDGTKVFISIVNPGSIRSSIEKGTVLIE
ncbi:CD73 [Mytilus edulis]|uniref:5'-nucleotidase n=1 Tax=Mytilus edulis TaxID=6550 RepID=A0A8S3R0Y4_MYTED|nr:CD73 [Mytilus edulis]